MCHSCAISSVCCPIDSPVRGSLTFGGCGASSAGEKPLKAARRWPIDLAFCASTSRWANFSLNTIGASEVVSEPMAMPDSICPVAILACRIIAACRLVPQACCKVMPGVDGASLLPSTASRARFQSLEWVTTAPPIASSICTPFKLYLSTRPFSAAVSIARFD